jgi:hypothetical protein
VSRTGIIGLIAFLAVAAFVAYQSFLLAGVTCEVCMSYRGGEQCRTVSAATEEEALQGAVVNACAFISSGVTDSMACQRQEPASKRCF